MNNNREDCTVICEYNAIPPHARKIATSAQMREFDRRASDEFGVPSIVLMENAGRNVFDAVRDRLGTVRRRRVAVVCGKGNNGGDGFVVARHLRDAGADVHVLLLGDPNGVTGDAKVNLHILRKTGLEVKSIESAADVQLALDRSELIVDAIFGTGLRGDVQGLAADAIHAINASGLPVVSVDIPSGLDADTGRILGVCVKAECTVTFALPKIGLLSFPGATCVGNLIVGDIGIPLSLYDEVNIELTGEEWVCAHLPKRPSDGHKGTFGTTVVLAGSRGFTGAAAMASEAVLRVGAGLSTLGIPLSLQDIMATKLTEVMTRGLPETEVLSLSTAALEPALTLCDKAASVVLGCGLGTHASTCEFVQQFISAIKKPIVVDADGLNCLADAHILEGAHGDLVITPHPGEMARLLGISIADVQTDRIGTALAASSRFHCVTVLKGARTLIAEPSGRVYMNPTGNSGMATGGTGDVLSGTIGGLLAQGLSPLDAAVCGVYVHGRAGDIAASTVGMAGMIAGDVLRALPEALMELYGC